MGAYTKLGTYSREYGIYRWLLHVSTHPQFLACEFQAPMGPYMDNTIATSDVNSQRSLPLLQTLTDLSAQMRGSSVHFVAGRRDIHTCDNFLAVL